MTFSRVMAPILLALALSPPALAGQLRPEIGLGSQLYPTGLIVTAHATIPVSRRVDLSALGGFNLADRGDFGEHAQEEGDGGGFGLRWRWHFRPDGNGFHLGMRTDLWFLTIDWTDPGSAGVTKVTVLQPTGLVGWRRVLGPHVAFEVSAALGAEINVRTRGEPVGEGAILLGGSGSATVFRTQRRRRRRRRGARPLRLRGSASTVSALPAASAAR